MPSVFRGLLFSFLYLVASLIPTTSSGQEVILVKDPPRCVDCRVTLQHVVRMGEREGPGRVMQPSAITQDSRGNYLIAHADGGYGSRQIWVFDAKGDYVRTVGREGEGPGEFLAIQRIDVLAGDTIEVFDPRNSRKTTLSSDYVVINTQPFEGRRYVGSERLPDGRFVIIDHQRTPGRVGYPLLIVSPSGEIQRAFGSIRPEYRPQEPAKLWKSITLSPDGSSIWSVGWGDYQFELWDTTGSRHASFRRDASWFEPYVLDRGATPDGPPPQPQVRHLQADSVGRLWVLVRRPREDWQQVLRAHMSSGGRTWDIPELWDWVVEVIDPGRPELLVSDVLPTGQYTGFLGTGMIVSYREDAAGYPFLDVWRLDISPTRGAFTP